MMTKDELSVVLEKHKLWLNHKKGGVRANLNGANLSRADLSMADLSGANLNGANLNGADLDYSVIPLWCGSLHAEFDDRQVAQIVYHAVRAGLGSKNVGEETKTELRKVVVLANKFHRVNECGEIRFDAKEEQ